MVSKTKWLYLSIPALMAAIFGLLHHYIVTGGVWFQWTQLLTLPTPVYPFWHHEPLIAMAFVGWITLLVVYLVKRNMVKKWGEQ